MQIEITICPGSWSYSGITASACSGKGCGSRACCADCSRTKLDRKTVDSASDKKRSNPIRIPVREGDKDSEVRERFESECKEFILDSVRNISVHQGDVDEHGVGESRHPSHELGGKCEGIDEASCKRRGETLERISKLLDDMSKHDDLMQELINQLE